jgi:hypothetical protein
VEFVRRAYVLGRGDVERLIELYHEDAEWRDLQHAPDTPEVVRGKVIFANVHLSNGGARGWQGGTCD